MIAAPGRYEQGMSHSEEPEGGEEAGQPQGIGADEVEVTHVAWRRRHGTDRLALAQPDEGAGAIDAGLQTEDRISVARLLLRHHRQCTIKRVIRHGRALRVLVAL